MFNKSTSFWLSVCVTSLILPFSMIANRVVANDILISQHHHEGSTNRGNSSKNVGGPLAQELQGKPVVIDIYAGWCSACKNVGSTMSKLKQQYGNKVNFIVFDVTDKAKANEAQLQAKKLGLEAFFAQNKSQTGSVTIVDPKTGNILAQYRNNNKLNDYTSVLNSALSQ